MLAIQRLVALSLLVFNGVNIGCIQAEAGAHQVGGRDHCNFGSAVLRWPFLVGVSVTEPVMVVIFTGWCKGC